MSILRPQPVGIPAPTPSLPSQPYWEACAAGKLLFQRCQQCKSINILPAFFCSNCYSAKLAWEESGGKGRLYSWTVVWRPQHPTFVVPYAPAVVALEEGANVLSAIIHCAPEEISVDMPLQVEFHRISEAITLPYFKPAQQTTRGSST
jgi:uncharacterized OB-fold protein